MPQYTIKRILIAIPTTIGALTFIFFTMRILPGEPAAALLGEAATPEALADMPQLLGLDKPLIVQHGTYLWGAVQGDFGRSIATNYPATSYIRRMVPDTLLLALSGIGVAILIGGEFSDPFSIIHHLVLSASALGLTLASFVTRQTRSAMLEVISQDDIRTARAKGVHEGRVISEHALRNTLIPLVTVLGRFVGTLLTGAVRTEGVLAKAVWGEWSPVAGWGR
jgi:ABC-type dipeptide/oligopeptide/nickel transport system permease component